MKQLFKYIVNGLKYFILQTLLETALIIILMYFGLPYSGISVGSEPLWEIIITVLGYHAMFKSLIYSWIYLLLFIVINFYIKSEKQIIYSFINGGLSLLLPLSILILRGLTFTEMTSIFIAALLASTIIIASVNGSSARGVA